MGLVKIENGGCFDQTAGHGHGKIQNNHQGTVRKAPCTIPRFRTMCGVAT